MSTAGKHVRAPHFYTRKTGYAGVYLFFLFLPKQGRRRALKSGPAEDMVECRRHERGRAREGVAPSR